MKKLLNILLNFCQIMASIITINYSDLFIQQFIMRLILNLDFKKIHLKY
jgi:hypothetical protein